MESKIGPLEKGGYLSVMETKPDGSFTTKRRWFVLKHNLLNYYRQPKDSTPVGSILLSEQSKLTPGATNSQLFQLVNDNASFRLIADSLIEKSQWLELIERACNGHANTKQYEIVIKVPEIELIVPVQQEGLYFLLEISNERYTSETLWDFSEKIIFNHTTKCPFTENTKELTITLYGKANKLAPDYQDYPVGSCVIDLNTFLTPEERLCGSQMLPLCRKLEGSDLNEHIVTASVKVTIQSSEH